MKSSVSARRNPFQKISKSELADILNEIPEQFGKEWLSRSAYHPVREVWHRQDGLATCELVALARAIRRVAAICDRGFPGLSGNRVELRAGCPLNLFGGE